MQKSLKIAISAGEPSGDLHLAKLINEISRHLPETEFAGFAGEAAEQAGAKLKLDIRKTGSLNGFNLFKIIFNGLRQLSTMIFFLYRWKPDLLILVDYPDFNMRLAKFAKLLNIPRVYFIPPKVWAWREARVRSLKKDFNLVAGIFPFEKDFFESRGLNNFIYIGHPYTSDSIFNDKSTNIKSELNINTSPIVAIFPGSRKSEVLNNLKTQLSSLEQLKLKFPDLQAFIARAPNIHLDLFKNLKLPDWIKIVADQNIELLKAADVGILKCGTCNLEAAYLGLPHVIIYKASRLANYIVNKFVKIKSFSLPNIIEKDCSLELIQDQASVENITNEVEKLLVDQKYVANIQNKFKLMREKLHAPSDLKGESSYERLAILCKEIAIKHSKRKGIYSRVIKYLKPYRKQFAAAIGCMVVFGASDGVVPFLVKVIQDEVFSKRNASMLYLIPGVLIIYALIRAVADFGQQFVMAKVGHNIIRDLRNQTNAHLLKLSPRYYLDNSVGNLLSRFTSDVTLVKDLLTVSVASVLRDSIRIFALLIAAFYLDPILACIAFIVFPLGILPVYQAGRRTRKLSKEGQEAIGRISSLLQESILGNRVVKLFNREKYEEHRFETENEFLNKSFIKNEKVKALSGPINEVLASFGIAAVILYGGLSVINEGSSQGRFIGFVMSVLLLYDPFKKLSRVNSQIQQGVAGAERIFEILDTPVDIIEPTSPKVLPVESSISFKNVSFAYDKNQAPVLKNINLHVATGSKVAIVGFSGSGKSTLIDLVPRFMDPDSGNVFYGGVDVRELKLTDLRSQIGLVGQHTFLFNDSIYNNIAYGAENCSEQEVFAAAKAAFAYDFIMKLPDNFATIVGEGGFSLSGGERQRIAIARAILKNAPVLVLDEATAALDNQAEREVQAALDKLGEGRTSIVIAHRLSTIRNADLIVVMENGEIVEQGSHQELLQKNGVFAKLHALQFGKQDENTELVN